MNELMVCIWREQSRAVGNPKHRFILILLWSRNVIFHYTQDDDCCNCDHHAALLTSLLTLRGLTTDW